MYKTLRPVFVGTTESADEVTSIVFYTDNDNELDAYIKVGDNPVTPLASEFKMEMGFDPTSFICTLYLDSVEWIGTAVGSKMDLELEPYYKFEPRYHTKQDGM